MERTPSRKQKLRGRRERESITGLGAILVLTVLAVLFFKPQLAEFFGGVRNTAEQPETDSQPAFQRDTARGKIYDRNFTLLAGSYQANGVYARPLELHDPRVAADKLAVILALDKNDLLTTLKSERGFVWLGRKLGADKTRDIEALNIEGIYITKEMNRFYPHRQTAAHVIGFVQDGRGLDGLEFQYDALLRGEPLHKTRLPLDHAPSSPGADISRAHLILSLDLQIQSLFEQHLAKLVRETGAAAAMAAVMSQESGELLALANLPSYDPNRFWKYNESDRYNRLIAEALVNGLPTTPAGQTVETESSAGAMGFYGFNQRIATQFTDGTASDIVPGKIKTRVDRWTRQADPASLTFLKQLFADAHSFMVDLPDSARDRKSAADVRGQAPSALQLLASFAGLLNNGRGTSPSVLAAVTDQASKSLIKITRTDSDRHLMDSTRRDTALELLHQVSQEGPGGSLLLETCLAPDYLVRSASNTSRSAIEESIEMTPGNELSRQILLGAVPAEGENLTFIIVLDRTDDLSPAVDGAAGRNSKFSPLLTMGRGIIPEMLLYAQRQAAEVPEELWQKTPEHIPTSQKEITRTETTTDSPDRQVAHMPDLIGRSLRGGLQIVQQYGLQVKITGSGRIVKQHPKPGSPVEEGDICVLELQMDN